MLPNYYYQPQMLPTQQQPQQNNNGIIWVQGEAGAKSYLVAPNTSVQLWDSEAQSIYIKSADASGIPSIKIIDYTFRENTPSKDAESNFKDFATKGDINTLQDELNALKSKLERLSNKRNGNGGGRNEHKLNASD